MTDSKLKAFSAIVSALMGCGSANDVRAQDDARQVQQITITAEKRLATVDDTPAAVSVLDGARLDEWGATQWSDLATQVPDMAFTTGQGLSQIFIRGIGNYFIAAGGDPGVAMYQDGSYVSDMNSTNVGLFDTQRVEVMRGPQGALYGRNAIGGAIDVISARPTASFVARAGVLVGNDDRVETEGFFSGPLGDSATSARLSYQVKSYGGYTDNPLAGIAYGPVIEGGPSTVGPRKLDDLGSRALRFQTMTALPGNEAGRGQLRLIASHYRESEAGTSVPLLLDPVMVPQLLGGVLPSTDPRSVKSQGASNRISVDAAQVLYEQPFSHSLFDLVASWRRSSAVRMVDSDSTEAAVGGTNENTSSDDRSVDLHLASTDAGALQWLVGATALQFDQRQALDIPTQVPLGFLQPGQPLDVPLPGGVEFEFGGKVRARSVAAYTDLRYALSPTFSLLAGVRLDHDGKSADEYQTITAFGVNGTGAPSASWNNVPASVGAEYRPASDLMGYAKLSHGFKAGAVNLGALQPDLVKPETVDSAEVGLKTELLDRRLSLAAAVFDSRYRDMQVEQLGPVVVELTNASAARIGGFELEASARPSSSLSLGVGLGFMSPEYSDFVNTDQRNNPSQPVNVRGRQLAEVSREQASVRADYAVSMGAYLTSLHADFEWRSRIYFTEFNTSDAEQGGYGLLNFGASIRPTAGAWKAYAQLRNATNTTVLTSMSIGSPLVGSARQVTYTPPRQFAIGATLDF